MYGLDLGSRHVKLVKYESPSFVESAVYDSISFLNMYLKRNEDNKFILKRAMLDIPDDIELTMTGYGKINIELDNVKKISEVKAHAYGAMEQTGLDDFTFIDLGGQDTKIVKVRNQKVVDFEMNDKCAASSGRYLENMANMLQIDLMEMGQYYENPIELNSTCAIFGETEVLSKVAEGISKERIAAAVNKTIVTRIQRHLIRLNSPKIVVVGGIAMNKAVLKFIEQLCEVEVEVPVYPQLNGAIGCAVRYKFK